MRASVQFSKHRDVVRAGLVGLAAMTCSVAAPAWGGDPVPSAEVRQNLYSSCFADDSTGWAVGDLGRIFYTTDGAETWQVQGAGTKRPFVSVACIDTKRAWIAGQAGQIARTTDGGNTWEMIASGSDRQLLAIAFTNEKEGVAVGDQGTILRTEDGGSTWTAVPVPPETELPEEYFGIVEPSDIVLYSVTWSGPSTVAIAGEFGIILISQDGGRTFAPSASGVETTLFGISFADANRGWAVGMNSMLLITEDGGETWNRQTVKSPPGFSLSLYDLVVRGNLGWAVGNSGFLLLTTDAGATWQLVDVPPQMGSYWFREVSLLPSGKGYVVGATGIVLQLDGKTFKANKDEL